jgi:hypothetical protein
MFNYKEGRFPMTYLGFPIADMKLSLAFFDKGNILISKRYQVHPASATA